MQSISLDTDSVCIKIYKTRSTTTHSRSQLQHIFLFLFQMGLFKKIGNFFKKAGRKIWGGVKTAGKWVARKVVPIIHTVSGIAQHIPGIIGDVAEKIHKGTDLAKKVIDQLPSSKVKDKLSDMADKVDTSTSKVKEKIDPYAQKIAEYGKVPGNVERVVKEAIQKPTPIM